MGIIYVEHSVLYINYVEDYVYRINYIEDSAERTQLYYYPIMQ